MLIRRWSIGIVLRKRILDLARIIIDAARAVDLCRFTLPGRNTDAEPLFFLVALEVERQQPLQHFAPRCFAYCIPDP